MKLKFNIFYLVLPLAVWGLISIYKQFDTNTSTFQGVAANIESTVNADNALRIERVLVKQGQQIKKGDILIEGSRITLDQKIDLFNSDVQTSNSLLNQELANIEAKHDASAHGWLKIVSISYNQDRSARNWA